jgi:hypothetical protein
MDVQCNKVNTQRTARALAMAMRHMDRLTHAYERLMALTHVHVSL